VLARLKHASNQGVNKVTVHLSNPEKGQKAYGPLGFTVATPVTRDGKTIFKMEKYL
jgi:hypothetical protein